MQRSTQAAGDVVERVRDVAGVVHGIDQGVTDDPIRGIGQRERQLREQVILERRLGGKIGFQVRRFAVHAAARRAWPRGWCQPELAKGLLVLGRCRRAIVVECVGELRAEARLHRSAIRGETLRAPVRLGALVEFAGIRGFCLDAVARVRLDHVIGARLLRTLEKRIALQFLLNEGGQLEIGELQKLDGLQKLRRHHQGLSLAHHELSSQSH